MSGSPPERVVLVVDDDRGIQKLIRRTLQRSGLETVSTHSGKEALAWLGEHRPSLMLLDLKLADMNGQEVLRRLDELDRSVPFIAITGQGDERIAVTIMKHGAVDYVVKDAEFLEHLPMVVSRALKELERETRLKKAEAQLKQEHDFITAVLNTSGALVFVLDRAGRVVRFNRACESLSGYRFDEISGRNLPELLVPEGERDSLLGRFEELVGGKTAANQYEGHWTTRSGEKHRIAWSNTTLTDAGGRVEFVIATGIDMTEHRRLEQEILEVSGREQRRIGQDLHDGLCQQLAGIEFMSEVLAQRLEQKDLSESGSAREIARLIRESISHTRGLAHGLSPVVLESEGLMAALRQLAENCSRMFQLNCGFTCRKPVLIDDIVVATHLYRIAQEAVNNAVKHGKPDTIGIFLNESEHRVVLGIRDNGKGFPRRKQPRRGMGLQLMHYRAGVLGGSILIQPRDRGGTEVVCSFPRALLEDTKT